MTRYEMDVKGYLDQHWSAGFDEMMVANKANGEKALWDHVNE